MQADVTRMVNDPNADQWRRADRSGCQSGQLRRSGAGRIEARPVERGTQRGVAKSSATKLSTPLDAQVCVLAFKHIHSGTAPVDTSFPHATLSDLGDPRYAGRVITTPTPAVTYPAMYPTLTSFTSRPIFRVPGQMNTNTGGATPPAATTAGRSSSSMNSL